MKKIEETLLKILIKFPLIHSFVFAIYMMFKKEKNGRMKTLHFTLKARTDANTSKNQISCWRRELRSCAVPVCHMTRVHDSTIPSHRTPPL